MDQEFTPDQQKQVKKAKAILWIGLTVIVVVGLAVAVYFIFMNPIERGGDLADVSKANLNININEDIKANSNINTTADSGLSEAVQIQIKTYTNQACESNEDCGIFPCNNNTCLIQKCTCSCHCPESICGNDSSVALGYCLSN